MMTTIKHHLTDALLMGYSAGNLPEAINLLVAAHLSLCDECRARLCAFDTLGGCLLDSDPATPPVSNESLAATLALIDGPDPAPARARGSDGDLPQPLPDYVGGDLGAVRWKPVGMGVKQAILPTSRAASARLLYIPAGTAVPDHGHRGMELTMVLQGAFSDEIDHFARGDVEIAGEDVEHMPIADIGEDCICLAVTDAPLRFSSWLPRLAQPFLRI